MPSDASLDQWLVQLNDYTARLTDRLNFLGLRMQGLGAKTPSALVMTVEELVTAAEALRTSQEELRAQAVELADAQDQAEAARRRYQELFDFCPDAYLVTDPASVIQEANQATSQLVGYARSYVLGKPLRALVDPSATEAFATRLAALRQTPDDRPQTWELRLRPRHNSAPLQANVHVAPFRDATGTLAGYRWLLRDVTEQRRMAAALAELQATQTQQLRTRTMELEAVVRMQAEARALDRAGLARLVHESIQALQHGAAPDALLAHILSSLQIHLGDLASPNGGRPAQGVHGRDD